MPTGQLSEMRPSYFWDNIGYGLPEYACHALNISVRHNLLILKDQWIEG